MPKSGEDIMSGHSKWANIKHKKQATDIRKGKIFSKVAKEIIVAVKSGGISEDQNPRLKTAILKARQVNMPKENIDRAIQKGAGKSDLENYEELIYEGYAPYGVAVIVKVTTDKVSRTLPEIKNIFTKSGGRLAETGSVTYLFEEKGVIIVEKDEEAPFSGKLLDCIIEAGAEDIQEENNLLLIYTEKKKFHEVLQEINLIVSEENYEIVESNLQYLSKNPISINEKEENTIKKMLKELDDHDDVQNVYYNLS